MWGWTGKRGGTPKAAAPAEQSRAVGHRLILVMTCLTCVEMAFAITILVLVTEELDEGRRCLLSDGPADMCGFSYAAAIIGILLCITQLFALCRPIWMTGLAAALAASFWLGYAITATVYAATVDNAPGGRFRVAVCALGWSSYICHALSFLLVVAAHRSGWKHEALSESVDYMIPTAIAFKERQAAAEAAKHAALPQGALARMSAAAVAALQRMSGGTGPAALGRTSMGAAPPVTVARTSVGAAPALGRSSVTSVASEILARPSMGPQPAVSSTEGDQALQLGGGEAWRLTEKAGRRARMRLVLPLLAAAIAALSRSALWCMPFPAPPAVPVPPAKRPTTPTSELAPNEALLRARQLFQGVAKPETPLVLPNGTAYVASSVTGQLLRSSVQQPDRREHVGWLAVPGGMVFHPDGYIIVCDFVKGLLAVDPSSGAVAMLSTRISDARLAPADADVAFCDDVDVSPMTGRIYFTDASRIPPIRRVGGGYDPLAASVLTALQGGATGRLLMYDPRTRITELLADGIWFANGVALSEDESYLLVAETFGQRLLRHWLTGPRAGSTEVFLEGLPGFPDGVSRAPGGASFWVALISTATPLVQRLPSSRLLRWVLAWVPASLQPAPTHVGLVAEVSAADGRVLRSLQDPGGVACHTLTSAVQVGGTLYMGSLATSHVCALDLPAS
ncbi:gluconolactonase isoform B [Micractinium conductrix]|uniref:Gluconolactonase isoform B n=1 Tax=Micractinium conductrix TaxID=554055 RepID=A0A2P6VS77_9CHLO|nr:gluconolactonase isoform B [Micractinium conductrix]|eukprot:PSC76943.1 gluconolactonase isoform B [Micractinium conductrix]